MIVKLKSNKHVYLLENDLVILKKFFSLSENCNYLIYNFLFIKRALIFSF